MLFAKIKEKLLNRRNDIEISEVTDNSGTPLDVEEMFAWLDEMKELTTIDGEFIEFGKPLFISDGSQLETNLIIGSITSLADYNSNSFFPSLDDQAGKVVKVNDDETGFEYGEVSGGTQLYKHTIVFKDPGDSSHNLIIVSTTSASYSSFQALFNDRLNWLSAILEHATTYAPICCISGTTLFYGGPSGFSSMPVNTYVSDTITPL